MGKRMDQKNSEMIMSLIIYFKLINIKRERGILSKSLIKESLDWIDDLRRISLGFI